MPKRPKTRFFTIFFNFFHILGYLEGEFSPTGPRNPILGAGFTRRCPGNGRMLKKTKTGQNFTRESDPLGGGGGGGGRGCIYTYLGHFLNVYIRYVYIRSNIRYTLSIRCTHFLQQKSGARHRAKPPRLCPVGAPCTPPAAATDARCRSSPESSQKRRCPGLSCVEQP